MASAFEQLAEQKIEQAIKDGMFDDLALVGQELDLEAYFSTPTHLRMSHAALKSNGFVPPEVEMMQEIHKLETKLEVTSDSRECKKLEAQITLKKTELAMAMDRIRVASKNNLGNQAW